MDSKMNRCRSSLIFRNQKIIMDYSIKDIIHDHVTFINDTKLNIVKFNESEIDNGYLNEIKVLYGTFISEMS